MALFGLFKKDKNKEHKGFHNLQIASVEKLTSDTVKITLTVPQDLKRSYQFTPGQYINVIVDFNGVEERRSYSICSGPNEDLAYAVKAIEGGKVSVWFNTIAEKGMELPISEPQGNFKLDENHKNVVAIAAGSGITPILSIAKALESSGGKLRLYYGNRLRSSIIFHKEIAAFQNVQTNWFLTGEQVEGYNHGRIDKDSLTAQIKADLDILKADAFFLCGPEKMILDCVETLKFFGVSEKKIHFELFTTPVLMKQEPVEVSSFQGTSHVKVILDREIVEFDMKSKGKTILDAVADNDVDAPYSCRGGVCCTCKAKILKGSALMSKNYSLTDEEVKDGYILTCQAHPTSEELTISYDE